MKPSIDMHRRGVGDTGCLREQVHILRILFTLVGLVLLGHSPQNQRVSKDSIIKPITFWDWDSQHPFSQSYTQMFSLFRIGWVDPLLIMRHFFDRGYFAASFRKNMSTSMGWMAG